MENSNYTYSQSILNNILLEISSSETGIYTIDSSPITIPNSYSRSFVKNQKELEKLGNYGNIASIIGVINSNAFYISEIIKDNKYGEFHSELTQNIFEYLNSHIKEGGNTAFGVDINFDENGYASISVYGENDSRLLPSNYNPTYQHNYNRNGHLSENELQELIDEVEAKIKDYNSQKEIETIMDGIKNAKPDVPDHYFDNDPYGKVTMDA